jgi:hypothetical protein
MFCSLPSSLVTVIIFLDRSSETFLLYTLSLISHRSSRSLSFIPISDVPEARHLVSVWHPCSQPILIAVARLTFTLASNQEKPHRLRWFYFFEFCTSHLSDPFRSTKLATRWGVEEREKRREKIRKKAKKRHWTRKIESGRKKKPKIAKEKKPANQTFMTRCLRVILL